MQWRLSIGLGGPNGRSQGNERSVHRRDDIRDRAVVAIAVVLFTTHDHSEVEDDDCHKTLATLP